MATETILTLPTHCDEWGDEALLTFRHAVLGHYRRHGRDLPWRRTHDPYSILVSEVMLQQTQVPRVLPKYREFLARFPDMRVLAASPGAAVLSAWQGLGYNRRGLALQQTAQIVASRHGGSLPSSEKALRELPGIGPATAGALLAFAYGIPVPFIETNIRAAIIHHFFSGQESVHDREVLPLVAATLDAEDPRTWYYALMDYGSWLKRTSANPSRRSRHHVSQSPFEGSRRQLRAQILRLFLLRRDAVDSWAARSDVAQTDQQPSTFLSSKEVAARLPGWPEDRVRDALARLAAEGFLTIEEGGTRYSLV